MLPTPAKFHYNFNLRDLSRIWEGMLHVEQETMSSLEVLLGLWKHECTRVIADRFTNPEDKDWFDKRVPIVFSDEIGPDMAARIPEEPYFVDFLRDPPEPTGDEPDDAELEAPKIYEPVKPMKHAILTLSLSFFRFHLMLKWRRDSLTSYSNTTRQ